MADELPILDLGVLVFFLIVEATSFFPTLFNTNRSDFFPVLKSAHLCTYCPAPRVYAVLACDNLVKLR